VPRLAVYESLNDAQVSVLSELLSSGKPADPRGLATKELLFSNFAILNPRARLLTLRGRHWDLAVALGEFCWHVAASNDADFIAYYASAWSDLASPDCTIPGSSYGRTIFAGSETKPSQWTMVKTLLKIDHFSRRAVLFFNASEHRLVPSASDVACASSFQFLIREGKLDAILTIRSNDAIFGLPYDVFFFSMLQEMMAIELGIELGTYFHSAGSMHLYERHIDLAGRTIAEGAFSASPMPAMEEVGSIAAFLDFEQSLRLHPDRHTIASPHGVYWHELAKVLLWHSARKRGFPRIELGSLAEGRYSALLDHVLQRGH